VTVAAPFQRTGGQRVGESEFVVDLSLKRDWFTPDQAKRLVDIAVSEGLVDRDDGDLIVSFDPRTTAIPEGFTPDESVLQKRSTFQQILDAITNTGVAKQDAVAAINQLQAELGVTIEAAGVLYARQQGLDVDNLVDLALGEL